ncbi:MAG: Ig-like domain-containing protein, partial [Fimbriimonas sp.]
GVAGLNWKVNVGVGPHTIRATFTEDDSYLSSEGTAPLIITGPAATELVAEPASGRIGNSVPLAATLTASGAPVSGQLLEFSVDGVKVGTATTDAAGRASYTYLIASGPAGSRPVRVAFAGNDSYAPSSGYSTLDVLKKLSSVTVDPATGVVGGRVTLRATVRDQVTGDKLAGQTVTFSLDGQVVGSAVTSGPATVAELTYTIPEGTLAREFALSASYAGNNLYEASSGTNTLTVQKAALSIWVGSRTVIEGDKVWYRASLKNLTSLATVRGKQINFYLNDVLVGSALTIKADGAAELATRLPEYTPAGNYTIRAEFVGDGSYLAVSGTAPLVAQKARTKSLISARTGEPGQVVDFRSSITNDVSKERLLGLTMSFAFNGLTLGSAVTAGVEFMASLQTIIPENTAAGSYVLRTDFAGNASYLPSFAESTLTVTKAKVEIWVGARSGKAGQTIQFRGSLRNLRSRTNLVGKTLRFKVGSTLLGSAVTAADGIASLNAAIPALAPGTYTLTVEFDGDAAYLSGSGSATLTVTP